MDPFQAAYFGEMVMWFKDSKICPGAGYILQDILFTVIVAMKFKDCYWTVIESLSDFSQWKDMEDIFHECNDSVDEDIYAYTYNPVETDIEQYTYGSLSSADVACFDSPVGAIGNQVI